MKKQYRAVEYVIFFVALSAMAALLFDAAHYSGVVVDALKTWAFNVLPCLFPYFVFSSVITNLDCTKRIAKIFLPFADFYRLNPVAGYVFFLNLVSGYPIGVKTACDLKTQNFISLNECEDICSSCNFAGCGFVLGTVAVFFDSVKIALIIYASVVAGALINGLIFLPKKNSFKNQIDFKKTPLSPSLLSDSIYSAAQSIINVGATIIIFCILAEIFTRFLPDNSTSKIIFKGIIEMTSGIKAAAAMQNTFFGVLFACFFVSFGGLCVFMQCFVFWQKAGVNAFKMLAKKTTQAVVSVVVCLILYIDFID